VSDQGEKMNKFSERLADLNRERAASQITFYADALHWKHCRDDAALLRAIEDYNLREAAYTEDLCALMREWATEVKS